MSISAASNSIIQPFTRPFAPRGATAPDKTPNITQPQGVEAATFAGDEARIYAHNAEWTTSKLNEGIERYNRISDDFLMKGEEYMRQNYGEEAASRFVNANSRFKAATKRGIEMYETVLRTSFKVSCETHTYNPTTDTYARGEFTATRTGSGFTVRFDSQKGPQILRMGSPFSDFVRNYPVQAEYLDYGLREKQLFDLLA